MSDIKLFQLSSQGATELKGEASHLEKPLQTLIETNLETLLGVRFIATEHSTGKAHGGRIDSLDLDENSSPVILEYKRSSSETVINQGLFYLDWLTDHQAEFQLLVMDKLGKETADEIDWSAPRLVCIAADFTKYDGHAVQQFDRNIELVRYRKFGDELLLFELVNATSSSRSTGDQGGGKKSSGVTRGGGDKPLAQSLEEMTPEMSDLLSSLDTFLTSLGDDVQRKELKFYVAFKRLRNFTCVQVQKNKLLLSVALNPDNIDQIDGFTRDMRSVGHRAPGDQEITLNDLADLECAKPLLQRSYEGR